MAVRLRLALNKTEAAEPVMLFTGLPRRRPIWGSFFSAAAGQALIGWLGVSYLHFLSGLPSVAITPVLSARVLEISTNPDQHLVAPRIKIPDRGQRSEKGAGEKPAPGLGAVAPSNEGPAPVLEAEAGPPAQPARAPLRLFRMPEIPRKQSAPQTLVQLDLPPTLDLHPQLQVPAVVMLSSEPARKLGPKPFIAPPQKKKTLPVPNQVALELRPPIFQPDPGYVKNSSVLRPDPKLPAPVGAVSPVSGVQETNPKTQAATVTAELPAPPVNVISLPDRPIPAGASVVLPPLNQVSVRDSISGDGASPRGGPSVASSSTAVTGSDASAAARPGGGRGDAPAAAPGVPDARGSGASGRGNGAEGSTAARSTGASGVGAGGAGAKTGSGGNGEPDSLSSGSGGAGGGTGVTIAGNGTGIGPGAGPGRGSGAGPAGNSISTSTPLRIVRPITGNYEVAVVQSSGAIPGTAGLLKGRPVYSVYLSLGRGREWILQYCLPPEEKPRQQSQVVQLGNITPLSAPYAYLILKPTIQLRDGVRYGFIHAFVTTAGRFDHIVEVGEPVIDHVEEVIEALAKWEFRPAAKDGAPTMVEVLLCIPSA